MIKIGPAGIPLSCKGRTVKDGIIYTRNLELDTMQVQFVRGIRMTEEEAIEIGRVAQEAQVEVHVHAPYYTNLAGDQKNLDAALEKILSAARLTAEMGGKTLAVHCGLYHADGEVATMDRVVASLKNILKQLKGEGVAVTLALEVAGKQALFGSLDEILEVCRRVPGVIPILDFAHIHARSNGGLLTQEDFEEVFEKCKPLALDTYLIHFTGILYEDGNERHHLPIKKGDLRFEPLIETILDHDLDVTILSHSPILEHDAMYMKIVLDRVREKRELRDARQKAQDEAETEKARIRAAREKAAEAKRKAREIAKDKRLAARQKLAAAAAKAKKAAAKAKQAAVNAKKKAAKAHTKTKAKATTTTKAKAPTKKKAKAPTNTKAKAKPPTKKKAKAPTKKKAKATKPASKPPKSTPKKKPAKGVPKKAASKRPAKVKPTKKAPRKAGRSTKKPAAAPKAKARKAKKAAQSTRAPKTARPAKNTKKPKKRK